MNFSSIPPIALILLSSAITLIAIAALYALYTQIKSRQAPQSERVKHDVRRHHANPVMSPRPHQEWEAHGTLNPAAVEDDTGRVHLLYRAIGDDGLSHIGHASSADGLSFDRRSSFPVYQPGVEEKRPDYKKDIRAYDPGIYTSGGGWGGHEDPRAVRIGSRVYMTYTAFQGWDSVRIGLTSIAVADLKKERWNWRKPKLISAAGQVNKNWLIFPEKINGKYAILHSIVPNVLIDYVDDLDGTFPPIQSKRLAGPQPGRKGFWDKSVRGAGPPPIKTDIGWLLLYHAQDDHRYRLGAMILDKNDPTKVLYRSPEPILSPEMCYENDGKPGVVYASGAVVKDGELMVYYGGGDKHVCVAQTGLDSLLAWLMQYGKM
ncbi:MAG: hypothetical protein AAB365_01430 [Patescibacteria group bacterium]